MSDKNYSIDARRTEINTYKVTAADESEALELIDEGVETHSVLHPSGCPLHHDVGHGITEIILDDDENQEILKIEVVESNG